jgi:hypothetical protein
MISTVKAKKKKWFLIFLAGGYIVLMVDSILFVPVKASIGETDPDTVYGYCALWEFYLTDQSFQRDDSASSPPLTLKINITAWVLQYLFFTLVFITLLIRTLKHFNKRQSSPHVH